MTTTVYKNTAVAQMNSKTNAYFAFGREISLNGQDVSKGGYAVFVIKNEYVGQAGNLRRKWLLVEKNLSFEAAIKLLNKRVGFQAYAPKRVSKWKANQWLNQIMQF